jgi:hypothetical protein
MGYTDFVEDIWISVRAVADHYARFVDQRNNIFNDRCIFPNVIGTATSKADLLCCSF